MAGILPAMMPLYPGQITDVAGLMLGHHSDTRRPTGCSVVLCPQGAVAGVDVRGAAPGTRETDLLAPGNLVEQVHAVMLSGGSAWGLEAATGAVRWRSVTGRTYTLLKADSAAGPFTVLKSGIPATPPLNTVTDLQPGVSARYYRVRLD